MDLSYAVLSSGSCGNSYVFYDGENSIVVDCGLSGKQMTERLESANIPKESIRAVFITHLHPDHASGIKVFTKETEIPVYINAFSAKRLPTLIVRYGIQTSLQRYFNINDDIDVDGAFVVHPFELYHDCIGTVGFKITSLKTQKCAVVITDTGKVTDDVRALAEDADALFLESNYDDEMLKKGPYPISLQNRIRGDKGHLSNKDAREFICAIKDKETRKIHLIHVSDNNNTISKIRDELSSVPNEKYSCLIPLERGEFYKGSV